MRKALFLLFSLATVPTVGLMSGPNALIFQQQSGSSDDSSTDIIPVARKVFQYRAKGSLEGLIIGLSEEERKLLPEVMVHGEKWMEIIGSRYDVRKTREILKKHKETEKQKEELKKYIYDLLNNPDGLGSRLPPLPKVPGQSNSKSKAKVAKPKAKTTTKPKSKPSRQK